MHHGDLLPLSKEIVEILYSEGLVKVLFVKVSEPARDARSASVTAVLNCARVPETVFEPKATVLFVKGMCQR